MIIIERSYDKSRPEGGYISIIKRKAFLDDDVEGVQGFLDERSTEQGYPWRNLEFRYIKL